MVQWVFRDEMTIICLMIIKMMAIATRHKAQTLWIINEILC